METDISYGLLTLLPPVIVIGVALYTKLNFESLMLGAWIAFIMSQGFFGSIPALLDSCQTAVSENAWMYIVLALVGSLITLLSASKGTFGFAKFLQKYAKSEKKTLMFGWVLGLLIFIDDYLNVLTVSACTKEVSDRQRTPREMLAYVLDSTGAPVCILVPLSTWAVFYGNVFAQQEALAELGDGAYLYLHSIPFAFYGFTAVILVPLVILGIVPKIGAMKKAYKRVDETGMVYSELSAKLNEDELSVNEPLPDGKIIDFLIPMAVVVGVAIWKDDLLTALVIGICVAGILYIPRKVMKPKEFCEVFTQGLTTMLPMIAICMASQVVKMSMDSINLPTYVVNAVLPFVNPDTLAAITFVVVALLAFVTGSSWGVPVVCVPIIVPLAVASGAPIFLVLGAIASAAAFGSHACFYTDVTIMSSQVSKINNMEHVLTQLPYAIIAGLAAVVLYLVFGFVL